MEIVICIVIGYLCGCFLTAAAVVKKVTGKSVFETGSCNPGMANVMANVGKKEGVLVLVGDILKTLLAFALSWIVICLLKGSWDYEWPLLQKAMLWSGLGAVMGHNYPFWHKFKGGKGVTVTTTYLVFGLPIWGALASIIGGVITIATGDLWFGAILIPLIATPFAFWKLGIQGGIVLCLMLLMMIQKNIDGVIKVLKGEEYRRFHKK